MISYWLYFIFPWLLWLAALAARIWAAKVVAPFLSTPLLVITGILLLVVPGAIRRGVVCGMRGFEAHATDAGSIC